MRLFEFPDKPVGTTYDLWRATLDLVWQLKNGAKSFPIADQTVGTAVTAIRHGLRGAPQGVSFEPTADCRWWVPQLPDAQNVYLRASVSVTGTVRVHP